jgi:hypothetical protein
VIVVGLTTSRLSPLQDTTPLIVTNLFQAVDCWDGDFDILMSFKFSLFFLIPLYIFWISSVFINKVLQGSDELLI